ncbi:MAG: hypothetical protein IKD78_01850 [Bacteroidales bacterium]|nr:hypothetical protein [Bacteroidales bacterium]
MSKCSIAVARSSNFQHSTGAAPAPLLAAFAPIGAAASRGGGAATGARLKQGASKWGRGL